METPYFRNYAQFFDFALARGPAWPEFTDRIPPQGTMAHWFFFHGYALYEPR